MGRSSLAAGATQKGLSRGPMKGARFGGATVLCGVVGARLFKERLRQNAPQPLVSCRSAAAFPFAGGGVSSSAWDGVQEIETSFLFFTLVRRARMLAIIHLLAFGVMDRVANTRIG